MAETVLIVDDQSEEALPLCRYLERQGYAVRFANGGAEALCLIEATTPDMIICDLEMPDLGGYQVLEAIAADPATREIPFLLANTEWTIENWSRKAGGRTADTHLSKPYVVREVFIFVKRIFQSITEDKAAVSSPQLSLAEKDV